MNATCFWDIFKNSNQNLKCLGLNILFCRRRWNEEVINYSKIPKRKWMRFSTEIRISKYDKLIIKYHNFYMLKSIFPPFVRSLFKQWLRERSSEVYFLIFFLNFFEDNSQKEYWLKMYLLYIGPLSDFQCLRARVRLRACLLLCI